MSHIEQIKKASFLIALFIGLVSCQSQSEETKQTQTTKTISNESIDVSTPISPEQLKGKTAKELRILRNEIFARKGYVFKDSVLHHYFSRKEWYQPSKNATFQLSEIEKANIELIKKEEQKFKPFELPQPYTSIKRLTADLDQDGSEDVVELAQSQDQTEKVIFVSLSSHSSHQKTSLVSNDEYYEIHPYLVINEDTVKYGFTYPGTSIFSRNFALRYDNNAQNLRLIHYSNSERIIFGHFEKKVDLLSGKYTISQDIVRQDAPANSIHSIDHGKQNTIVITPPMIDEILYEYLDHIGNEFDKDPEGERVKKTDCRQVIIKRLQLDFKYGKLDYLGNYAVFQKELKEFVQSLSYRERHTYSKSYYLHRDWNLDYIEEDECQDKLYLNFNEENSKFSIQINNCSLFKEDGEAVESSEQSIIFEYELGNNCTYQFKRINGAG